MHVLRSEQARHERYIVGSSSSRSNSGSGSTRYVVCLAWDFNTNHDLHKFARHCS